MKDIEDKPDDSVDDERLCAWLDGELPAEEADRLSDRLAADPALARRLGALRGTDETMRRLYAAVDELPLPQQVLDLLQDDAAGAAGAEVKSNVVAFPRRGMRSFLQMPVAIAASVALVAGFLVSGLMSRDAGRVGDPATLYARTIPGDSELHRLLESGLSTEARTLDGGADARVVLTFQAGDGDWCRQFELAAPAGSTQALACRRGGNWQVETASFTDARDTGGPYQQASGATTPALDAAVEALIGDREPLAAEEESRLISKGWEKPEE
jgi:negative regulator of sigma E activity